MPAGTWSHNGLPGHTAGGDDRRRHLAHDVLRAHRPHIVLRLVTHSGQKRTAIIGGDCNSCPHRTADERVPLPGWSTVRGPAHFEHRTVRTAAGRVSDTIPDEVLASTKPGGGRVFVELGHHAAAELGQPGALDATASLWRKDPGHRSRIDRVHCTPDLASALRSLEVVADETVAGVSTAPWSWPKFDRAAFRRALTPSR